MIIHMNEYYLLLKLLLRYIIRICVPTIFIIPCHKAKGENYRNFIKTKNVASMKKSNQKINYVKS